VARFCDGGTVRGIDVEKIASPQNAHRSVRPGVQSFCASFSRVQNNFRWLNPAAWIVLVRFRAGSTQWYERSDGEARSGSKEYPAPCRSPGTRVAANHGAIRSCREGDISLSHRGFEIRNKVECTGVHPRNETLR
jgi:hypothetical protein